MEPAGQPALSNALDNLWAKFLPQLEERVAVLETAAAALAAGPLSREKRREASAAAHKLAGVLGTFGLSKGTVLSREAEIVYSGEPETDPAAATRLAAIAAQLRGIVHSRR
jgi:HPt (histidine-containing phosphotransfer) domain-containing protein